MTVWAVFYPIPPYRGLACLFSSKELAERYASHRSGYTLEEWRILETEQDLAMLLEDADGGAR